MIIQRSPSYAIMRAPIQPVMAMPTFGTPGTVGVQLPPGWHPTGVPASGSTMASGTGPVANLQVGMTSLSAGVTGGQAVPVTPTDGGELPPSSDPSQQISLVGGDQTNPGAGIPIPVPGQIAPCPAGQVLSMTGPPLPGTTIATPMCIPDPSLAASNKILGLDKPVAYALGAGVVALGLFLVLKKK